jgi:antirestriction protein ArdC
LGYSPKKGAKTQELVFWQHEKKEPVLESDGQPMLDVDGQPLTQTVKRERPLLCRYEVYQARDLVDAEGQPMPLYQAPAQEVAPLDRATDILANSGVAIKTGNPGGPAAYDPRTDTLNLPPRELTPDDDYMALAVKSLVEREVHWGTKADKAAQSQEERKNSGERQVVESLEGAIASMMVAQDLGLRYSPRPDAFTSLTWKRHLEKNPDLLFQAAARAEKVRARVVALEHGPEKAKESKANEAGVETASKPLPELCRDRVYLDVPWDEKDTAKSFGATWDNRVLSWCARPGVDLTPLKNWIPEEERQRVQPSMVSLEGEHLAVVVPYKDREEAKEMGLYWQDQEKSWVVNLKHSQLAEVTKRFRPAPERAPDQAEGVERDSGEAQELALETVVLEVPFREKDQAKAAGAKFDPEAKQWLAPVGSDLGRLAKWIPEKEPTPELALAAADEFASVLKENRFVLEGPPLLDGRIHRVPVTDGQGQEGAYCASLLGTRPNGWLKNHRNGEFKSWLYTAQVMSPEAKEGLKKEAEARKWSRPPKSRGDKAKKLEEPAPAKSAGMGR